MRLRFALALLLPASSSCTLLYAIECPYDCYDAAIEAASDAPTTDSASDAGCVTGVTAAAGGGTTCIEAIDVGGDPVYAVTGSGNDIFILTSSGTVWTCAGTCDAGASIYAPSDAGNAQTTLAVVDGGVLWATAKNAQSGAIMLATSNQSVPIAKPAFAAGLASYGTTIFWAQTGGQGIGLRSCSIGSDCLDAGSPAGTLVLEGGILDDMTAVSSTLAYCDGTQVVVGSKVITEQASVIAGGGAGPTNLVFWNNQNDIRVHGCTAPTCSTEFAYEGTTLGSNAPITQIGAHGATGFAWIDSKLTMGACSFSTGPVGSTGSCPTVQTFALVGADVAQHPHALAYNGSAIVFIDGPLGTARALRVPLK